MYPGLFFMLNCKKCDSYRHTGKDEGLKAGKRKNYRLLEGEEKLKAGKRDKTPAFRKLKSTERVIKSQTLSHPLSHRF